MKDYVSSIAKLRSWLVYGSMQGLVDFQRDFGLDCRGCKNVLVGSSSLWCKYFGEEILDYRIAETCEAHDGRT